MQLEFLDKLLGEGNYHWVYALKNQPRLAIKIAKENTQQLAKEVHILSALQHTGQFPKVTEMSFRLYRLVQFAVANRTKSITTKSLVIWSWTDWEYL